MGIPSIDRATENLVKWSTRGEWEALQREVYAEHFEPVTEGLDLSDDVLGDLPDESIGVLRVFILEDFFTARFGEHGERNVIDDYLRRAAGVNRCPQGATSKRSGTPPCRSTKSSTSFADSP